MALYGELGFFPPSLHAQIKALCYYKRLYHLPRHRLAKRAFDSLMSLHDQGFNTWIGKVKKQSQELNIDIDNADYSNFKELCKDVTEEIPNTDFRET